MQKTGSIKGRVSGYIDAVLSGKKVTGKYERLAVERHVRDLKDGEKRGLYFDEAAGTRVCEFFERFLIHSKGEWAGRPFILEPWEAFIKWCLFGWMKENGLRRFRTAHIEVARKNGKTTDAAGVGNYLFIADGEEGAEIYYAATKREQAKLAFDEARRMIRKSPELSQFVEIYGGPSPIASGSMFVPRTNSRAIPLGADADTLDGLNIHCAIVDELHAHKTRDLWDVLDTATGARQQPLIYSITTAGKDSTGICRENRDYSISILDGAIKADDWFAFICTIDEGDDWRDERVWVKANPNLGVSVKLEDLRGKAKKAAEMPSFLNAFLNLHLNVWTQQTTRWIDLNVWDEMAEPLHEEEFIGRVCHGGLDLSSVSDLTAFALVFEVPGDPQAVDVLFRFWCPEARLHDSHNRYRANYQEWARAGWLMTSPGQAIDYALVKAQIIEDAKRFNLVDLNIDRLFQGYQLALELEDELKGKTEISTMGMGYYGMSGPSKNFETLVLNRKIRHGGHPVMRFCVDNVGVKRDGTPADNIKPVRLNENAKVDGVVALIEGLDLFMRRPVMRGSIYKTRGLLVL